MNPRRSSFSDRLFGEIDRAIKVLAAPAKSARPLPAGLDPRPALDAPERQQSARLMRVNHAGEVAAQALYQGQALTARDPAVAASLRRAAEEEQDHLAWCRQRLEELGGRTSLLDPLWYFGSFALGAAAGMLGDALSLGFIAEPEAEVEAHLRTHLTRLPAADRRSLGILEQMTHDEARHGADAVAMGAKPLPPPIRTLMRYCGRALTRSSYWV